MLLRTGMLASSAVRGTCVPNNSTTVTSYETGTVGGASTGVHWKKGCVEMTTSLSRGASSCGGSGWRIEKSAHATVTGIVALPTNTRAQVWYDPSGICPVLIAPSVTLGLRETVVHSNTTSRTLYRKELGPPARVTTGLSVLPIRPRSRLLRVTRTLKSAAPIPV